ncbi:MAG: glycosyltransferase family A protein [Fibrobacterota bacterium]
MAPRVSVIIPTFNRKELTEHAVRSVLAQTFRDYELIVVDDGSTDGTADPLAALFPQELTLLRQENRGVSAARNAGIRASHGEWIAFLDSDDEWLPRKLELQMAYLSVYPEWRICQTRERWVRKGVRVNPRPVHEKFEGDLFEASLARCLITPSSVMLQRSLLDETGLFDEALPACEDYDLWLRITRLWPVGLVDEELLIRYGGHADQLSALPGLDKYRIRSLDALLTNGGLTPGQAAATVAVLREKCAVYAAGCRKRGRVNEAEQYEQIPERWEA